MEDQNVAVATVSMEMEMKLQLQQQLTMEEQFYSNNNGVMHESSCNWQQIYAGTDATYPTALFPLLPNFVNPSAAAAAEAASSSVVYDPVLLPLNLPPAQPPLLRELVHYTSNGGGSLFSNEREEANFNGSLYENGDGVFEFAAATEMMMKSKKDTTAKHFATERHRRVLLNDKYHALRSLVPCPTKDDRASIVGDAINHINELKRTVDELKVLLEKKRCERERLKRPKMEVEENGMDGSSLSSSSLQLRSSWLHRKTKNTEVDVRIIDDEVTVKLVQQKRINCLLFVSKVLDELQLDLHHVAGGLIGDFYTYLFNSKICEDSSMVYASAVADKIIQVVDKQYAAVSVPPTRNSY